MDWLKTIASAAPILGTVVGGPVGGIVGKGLSLIAEAFGCEADEDSVAAAIKADPQAVIKLKELELQHQTVLIEWQRVQLQAELENTKDARSREVLMTQAGSWMGSVPPALVSLVVTVGFFIMLYVVLGMKKEEVSEAALLLLGALSSGFAAVLNYYLGSSLGSYRKNSAIEQMSGTGRNAGKTGGM
ncbi:hypothetical protein N1030_01460 [Desulfovibrio mangrovi]|uniref:hypothetical protein n=1 Tax=Desulfovibrio mangrovi TaxID=2976983 RepID=UPI0022458DFB|nr:hypothetical protein [Desulfovibrio mangrovi]UZP67661.1 hypothetical protein N1030_01460 [Desulfovibrio mangrovi]